MGTTSLLAAILALAQRSASPANTHVTTKRVFSTTNWTADYNFFLRYLGVVDPSGGPGPGGCLYRDLAWVLPVNFGIHHPQSNATMDRVPGGRSSAEWDAARVALTNHGDYSAFLEYSTAFFVPDLGKHVALLRSDAVPFVARMSADSTGAPLFSVTISSPGSGQAFEIQAPECSGCPKPTAFAPAECGGAHALQRPVAYYTEAWERASAPPSHAQLPNGLSAPLITQIRVRMTDLTPAVSFLKAFFDTDMPAEPVAGSSGCSVARWGTSVSPFDGGPGPDDGVRFGRQLEEGPPGGGSAAAFANYTLDYVFISNPAAPHAAEWTQWEEWANDLHAAWVGQGWGFDRVLDYHVKVMSAGDTLIPSQSETEPGVSLDRWAELHNQQKVPYSAFNVSNSCPGPGPGPPGFGSGGMIYSSGIGGIQVRTLLAPCSAGSELTHDLC
eukprot:COSAG04_NODE_3097_length_3178_cov_4.464761_2_plen_442_part_00